MASHRALRIAEAIRETVSAAILFDLSDPRVKNVTVLRVEVPGDLRQATIYVSIMGNDAERKLSLRGLHSATGFLQAKVAKQLQIRFVPTLHFKLDDSARKSVEMSKLIDEALASDQADRSPAPSSSLSSSPDDDSDFDDDDDFDDQESDEDEEENSAGAEFPSVSEAGMNSNR